MLCYVLINTGNKRSKMSRSFSGVRLKTFHSIRTKIDCLAKAHWMEMAFSMN